jgi:hypothetical protein
MSTIDLILLVLAVAVGVAYFSVRNRRKQAELKRHIS